MAELTVNDNAADLERIFHQVMSCEPAIHPREMEALADLVMNQEAVGRKWRLTALLASMDGAFYKGVSEDEEKAKTFAPTVEILNDFSKLMRTMADLAECSAMRLAVAGCNHEHFNDWRKEAQNV